MTPTVLWIALSIASAAGADARTSRPNHVLTATSGAATFFDAWRPAPAGEGAGAQVARTARQVTRSIGASATDRAFQAAASDLVLAARGGSELGPPVPSFFQRAGELPSPVSARVVAQFGPRPRTGSSTSNRHSGLSFDGDDQPVVRAVSPGFVVFSGEVPGLGQVIVLDHGQDYHSVYGFLVERDVAEGVMVGEGDALGRAGAVTSSGEREFYFEIRDRGVPVDPGDWLD